MLNVIYYVFYIQGAAKKNTHYKNLIIFRIIEYFLVKFSEIIRESLCH